MSKDAGEKKVLESLDNAFSDFAKNTKVPKKKKKTLDKVEVENAIEVLPANFEQVVYKENKEVAGQTKKQKKVKNFLKNDFVSERKEEKKVTKKHGVKKSPYFQKKEFLLSPFVVFGFVGKKNLVTVVLSIMMFGFVVATTYVTYAYVASRDNDLINSVARLVVLPENETPKVYIVQSEKADLFQNPLFKGIKVGDNVLTYPNSKRVIIYRGSEDKIVNIVSLE